MGAGLFAVLEMTVRVYLFGLAGFVPATVNSVRGLPQSGYTQPSPEPRLVFELKPNLDGVFKLVPFRTNSRGLRDQEYALHKPSNTFRIAVVGSSFALPAGVAIERAFHSLLEDRLSREFAPLRYEFINFAVGMYHPEQVLAMLELRALDYDPDVILFTATKLSMPWLVNDPASAAGQEVRRLDPEMLAGFQKSYPFLRSFLRRLVMQRMGYPPPSPREEIGSIEKLFIAIAERWSPAVPVGTPGARVTPDHRGEGSVIERMAKVRDRTGIPIALVRLEFEDKARLPIDLQVAEEARAHGIPYLDTRDAFRGTRASDFWIYELDPHPNWKAHEVFAQVIEPFLRSNGLLSEPMQP